MNLLSKLHKNSILTGPIESYCLVCGCLLNSEEESYAHIHEPSHVDKLGTVQQLADYNDCIIKCKEGYFCWYCNFLLPTIKRVSLHVSEPTHNENKNSQSITRHEGVILAFNRVVIEDRSWHGLDGSTCSVCNEDYDDEEVHKGEAAHVLNLIQVKCEFGDTFIYRKVDEVLFFCLTCNEILPILEKPTHHETEKHVKLYEKCKTDGTDSLTRKVSEKVATEPNNNYVKLPAHEATNGKPKEVENKVQNESSHDIDNSRRPNQNYLQESDKLETVKENKNTTKSVKTEKIQISEPKSEFQSNKSNLNLDNKAKNTYSLDKEHSEPKKTIETDKAVVKTPVNNEESNTAKVQSDKAEPYFYKYLKANNFIIKAYDGTAYCTLCDYRLNENYSVPHSLDRHHSILYAKHVARKNSELAEKTLNKPDNKTNQMNGGVKPDLKSNHANKENMPIKQDSQKAQSQLKPVQLEEKVVVAKDSKSTEDNTVEQKQNAEVVPPNETESSKESIDVEKPVKEQATNKVEHQALENQEKIECIADKKTVPYDEHDKVQIALNERNKGETKPEPVKPTAQNKKAVKKAQKKAAKAKISKTQETVLPKEIHEAGAALPEIRGAVSNKTATKEHTGDTETTQDVLSDKQTEGSETQKEVDSPEVAITRFAGDTELKTDKLMNILKTISQVNSTPKDVIINSKYVVGNLSFVLVVCDGKKAECVACEEGLVMDDLHKHINTEQHKSNVEECLVVTSLDDEFVRQVKTQEYHCGYCNMLLQNWEAISTHLDTHRHDDAKTSASWRLARYQPYFKNCETKEVRSVLTSIFRSTECVWR